jgi:hypothetical protein
MVYYLTRFYVDGREQEKALGTIEGYLSQLKGISNEDGYEIYRNVPDCWIEAIESRFRLPDEYLKKDLAGDNCSLVVKIDGKQQKQIVKKILKDLNLNEIHIPENDFVPLLILDPKKCRFYNFEEERSRRKRRTI